MIISLDDIVSLKLNDVELVSIKLNDVEIWSSSETNVINVNDSTSSE